MPVDFLPAATLPDFVLVSAVLPVSECLSFLHVPRATKSLRSLWYCKHVVALGVELVVRLERCLAPMLALGLGLGLVHCLTLVLGFEFEFSLAISLLMLRLFTLTFLGGEFSLGTL